MKRIAVVVPGIMGSELRLGDQVVWPGSLKELLLPYRKMKELLREDLVATDVIRKFSVSNQYATLIQDLRTCGFDETGTSPTLYALPYDWRKKNELAAAALADLIDRISGAHAGAEVVIIGHSMGGLVARFYLESGDFVHRAGFATVKLLVTLGTPHRGAPLALTAALGLERRLFLNADQVLQLMSDPRYCSLYQLLPPRDEPFAWNADKGASYEVVDVFDGATAKSLGLMEESLAAAGAFHAKFSLAKRPKHVRYFFFAGSRQVTSASVLVRHEGQVRRAYRVEQEDGGDGTVPIWSSLASTIQTQLVGGEHGTIYQNDGLRRTLAAVLGKPGLLAGAPVEAVDVAIRDRVVEPSVQLHVALSFASGVGDVDGKLQCFRVQVDADGAESSVTPVGPPQVVRYSGIAADKIGLVFKAPDFPGLYRLAFLDSDGKTLGGDDLFVQQN